MIGCGKVLEWTCLLLWLWWCGYKHTSDLTILQPLIMCNVFVYQLHCNKVRKQNIWIEITLNPMLTLASWLLQKWRPPIAGQSSSVRLPQAPPSKNMVRIFTSCCLCFLRLNMTNSIARTAPKSRPKPLPSLTTAHAPLLLILGK